MNGHLEMVECLLGLGADPTARDHKKQTPYNVCKTKAARTALRKFAGENLSLFEYDFPPLTAEGELAKAEKKRQQRAAQRKKKQERRAEDTVLQREKEAEQAEREARGNREAKIARMSQRELAAQAMERR